MSTTLVSSRWKKRSFSFALSCLSHLFAGWHAGTGSAWRGKTQVIHWLHRVQVDDQEIRNALKTGRPFGWPAITQGIVVAIRR
jgi:hypothetical protein